MYVRVLRRAVCSAGSPRTRCPCPCSCDSSSIGGSTRFCRTRGKIVSSANSRNRQSSTLHTYIHTYKYAELVISDKVTRNTCAAVDEALQSGLQGHSDEPNTTGEGPGQESPLHGAVPAHTVLLMQRPHVPRLQKSDNDWEE